MKKNMGAADRTIRLVFAAIILVLYFTNVITGILALVLMLIMGVLIATSLFSFCPMYFPFGISTKKKLEQ